MNSDIAISVSNVSKAYKIYNKPQDRLKQIVYGKKKKIYSEFTALKDISFKVKKRETIGIVGSNGAGKSTLLQIISKTLTPSSGTIEVNGRVAALLELGSGFNPDFTGRENVYLNGSILGLSKNEIDKLYEEIVSFAEIGEFIDQPVKTYSSGMVVRLAFAVQAVVPKEILIVDEALAVGDELFQRKCFSKIEEFKREGGTILFVSHSGSQIIELCDRAILLDNGRVISIGESKRIVNLYQKLIYAPPEKKAKILSEIQNTEINSENESTPSITSIASSRQQSVEKKADFDPSLRPKETIRYESNGAEIFDTQITTLCGNRVNNLLRNEKYLYQYYVKFHKDCYFVRFGMLIKTLNGVELGGANNCRFGDGIPLVKVGTIIKVEFSFVPNLNSGLYFMNAGVLESSKDGEVYIDRVIDVEVFRIGNDSDSITTAIIDFSVTSDIMIEENNS